MRGLIVNADDYGRSAAISAGIRYAHQRGIVTSTTVMINFPGAAGQVRQALAECPTLGIGVHLCLTDGQSLLPAQQIPSLVGPDGSFPRRGAQLARLSQLEPAEVRSELRAQIEATLDAGAQVDHLDSHHHATYLHPTVLEMMMELAAEYRIPVRAPIAEGGLWAALAAGWTPSCITPEDADALEARVTEKLAAAGTARPDALVTSFYAEGATLEGMLRILERLPAGVSEIMCHPGYYRPDCPSSYNMQREHELRILCHSAVRRKVANLGIELTTFERLREWKR